MAGVFTFGPLGCVVVAPERGVVLGACGALGATEIGAGIEPLAWWPTIQRPTRAILEGPAGYDIRVIVSGYCNRVISLANPRAGSDARLWYDIRVIVKG